MFEIDAAEMGFPVTRDGQCLRSIGMDFHSV